MARLQILELPEGSGDDRPPFLLVVDQADEATVESLHRQATRHVEDPAMYNPIADQIGARAVLVFEDTIDIPANDVPLDADGYPVKLHIEPDFETFRQQVQDEIRKAQDELRQTLNSDTERSPEE